jgi:hypothetical protein
LQDPQDAILAVLGRLEHLGGTCQKNVEGVRGIVLEEDRRVRGEALFLGERLELFELVLVEAFEAGDA